MKSHAIRRGMSNAGTMVLRAVAFAAVAVLGPSALTAQSGVVDLELVLAVDSSSSVSEWEFKLQMQGLALAFQHPTVIKAIEDYAPNGIAVTLVQWSGAGWQAQPVPFQILRDKATATVFAARVATTSRAIMGGPTALGAAINYCIGLLQRNQFRGTRRVIDISGDGVNNHGLSPVVARARATQLGITINGLAILNEEPTLDRYYRTRVIGGANAFMLTANDYQQYTRAIRIKLIQEISGVPIG